MARDRGAGGSDGLRGGVFGERITAGPGHPVGGVSGELARMLVQFRQVLEGLAAITL